MDYNGLINLNTVVYTFFGVLPSLVWLVFYLAKDLHPEPRRMILRIFLWGALIAIPTAFIEKGLKEILVNSGIDMVSIGYKVILFFVIVAPVEEFFKYIVVKVKVMNSPHLDEPVDIMLYMVISALGFAGLENILYLFQYGERIAETLSLSLVRFIGAIFLHTLCSAIIGYALAISFCEIKRKGLIVATGFLAAITLHGMFNFILVTLPDSASYPLVAFIMVTSAFIIFTGFEKLKKKKGICKIR
ncbi:MAG: PrsW family intramembrane metalloprotease [Candidatus Staskawiczbacteria bacterium]